LDKEAEEGSQKENPKKDVEMEETDAKSKQNTPGVS